MKKIFTIFVLLSLFGLNCFSQSVWTTKTPMQNKRKCHGVATVNNKIYVIGGTNDTWALTSFEEYNPVTDTWTTKTPIPFGWTEFGTAVIGDTIYCVGGNNGSITDVCAAYIVSTDTWITLPSLSASRTGLSAVALNGKLYAIGGAGWFGVNNSMVEEYNPATNLWTTKASMPVSQNYSSIAVVNGIIYSLGGFNDNPSLLKTAQSFNPITNTWSSLPDLPFYIAMGATTVLNNKIYIFGGDTTFTQIGNTGVLVYNPVNNSLLSISQLDTARVTARACIYNDKIFVIGGCYTSVGVYTFLNTNQMFEPANICYQTVYDTVHIYDTIHLTVTDTLIINASITGYHPVTYLNTIKIYPNPTSDHITIDYGNYNSMINYNLSITNSLGQTVFTSQVNQPQSYIDLSSWTGNGLYFVYLKDANNNIVDIKKIILQ
jgi:N-acetylneuraminic acid mutarotase